MTEQIRPADQPDTEEFLALVREYDLRHRRLAYRLLGDRDRMDDVLQEAYARAFRALPRFRGRSGLATWLYRIVYNTCIDELRRSGARKEVSLEEWRERGGRRDDVEQRLDLEAALASLSPELRAVVLLVDADELSYEEAAEVLGIPPGTVASRLSRARDTLKGALR
ncbi:MAG TPA: RNA polymerase sigma factor [Gaiellaceae bacterium]|nr:RNA polymerase sigma factor [Gaiellaceae bacterium]